MGTVEYNQMTKQLKTLVSEIKKAINSRCLPNGKAILFIHVNGERVKVGQINAGDFYTPIKIAESFVGVEKVEMSVF